jgi:hypothetical protein
MANDHPRKIGSGIGRPVWKALGQHYRSIRNEHIQETHTVTRI